MATTTSRSDVDLLGDPPTRPVGRGYAGRPGEGPGGETCGSCKHSFCRGYHTRRYWKCHHPRAPQETRGSGTDIRKRSPACQYWEPPQ